MLSRDRYLQLTPGHRGVDQLKMQIRCAPRGIDARPFDRIRSHLGEFVADLPEDEHTDAKLTAALDDVLTSRRRMPTADRSSNRDFDDLR